MKLRQIDRHDLDLIEPLWNELKNHHREQTTLFKRYYDLNTFEKRKAALLQKEKLFVCLASEQSDALGFCIASINHGIGEIDSLYVRSLARKRGIGSALVNRAMGWLHECNASPIRLLIGEGNESVLEYYEKLGFQKRAIMMELQE